MFIPSANKKIFQQLVYLNHKIDALTEENSKYEKLRLDLRVASYELNSAISKLTDSGSDSADVNEAIDTLRSLNEKLGTKLELYNYASK